MNDKIHVKQERIKKLEYRISKDQAEVKKLKAEIEQQSLLDIKNLADGAKMPLSEIHSLLQELIEQKTDMLS